MKIVKTTAPARRRKALWFVSAPNLNHKHRALALGEKGWDVEFYSTVDSIRNNCAKTGLVIVSDDGPPAKVMQDVQAIASIKALQGARLILTTTVGDSRTLSVASASNYRDIIPLDLEISQWCQRIMFAAAGKPLAFNQPPCQLTINQICAVNLPARITWMSRDRICVESRLQPPVGATLQLNGSLARILGLPTVTVIVEEARRTHLVYRFSDAFVARLSLTDAARPRLDALLTELRAADQGPKRRVFVALQSQDWRDSVAKQLDHPAFVTSIALQKQSIAAEPKFFSPDLVIIEDVLCKDSDGVDFSALMRSLESHVPMAVIGQKVDFEKIRKTWPNRNIHVFIDVPADLRTVLVRKLLTEQPRRRGTDADAAAIAADHEVSTAEVHVPARLTRVHPLAGQLALPFSIGNYALARLDAPMMRRLTMKNPWFKVTATWRDPRQDQAPFVFTAEFAFADTNKSDRQNIATMIKDMLIDAMLRYDARLEDKIERTQPQRLAGAAISGDPAVAQILGQDQPAATTQSLGSWSNLTPPVSNAELGNKALARAAGTSDFLAQIRPIIVTADKEADQAVENARKITEAAKSRTIRHLAIFCAIIAFMVAVIWAAWSSGVDSRPDTGKVWSDSFKKFQEQGGRSTPP